MEPGNAAGTALLQATVAAAGENELADVVERVAVAIAEAEPADERARWAERFAAWMRDALFLPAVPTLGNAGRGGQLAACFVLEAQDSLDSIYDTLRRAARIQQGSGGVGIHLSRLRASGTAIERSGGRSTGPNAFAELFAHSARVNSLSGRRAGAHLAILRDDHPDVIEFIRNPRAREDPLAGLGRAVGTTGELLEEARRDALHSLRDPSGREVDRIPARVLLDELTESIHATGEPTLVFLDRIAAGNPVPYLGRIEAVNPCGEQPLLPNESCVLGSLQLPAFLNENGELDVERMRAAARDAVRFLDDVIEVNVHPDEEIAAATRRTRKIGLGIMGFADLLLVQGIRYGSPTSVKKAHEIMRILTAAAREASATLAEERGPFPAWRPDHAGPKRRNAALFAVAPTGTVRLLAGCSGGLEPFLQPALRIRAPRAVLHWTDRWLARWLTERCAKPQLVLDALEDGASATLLPGLAEADRSLLAAAWEIPPEQQIAMQAAFQLHVDGAVSKTVHLGADIAPERIAGLVNLAHQLGCKGVAFYRHTHGGPPPEIRLDGPLCSACGS